MKKRKKSFSTLEKVIITDIAAEGNAIAKVENMVVFVPFVAPGDVVDIQITRKKRNYAEGIAIKYHSLSAFREETFCEQFQICGGCRWQHLMYEKQLFYKQKQIFDSLERIAKIPNPEILPIIASEKTINYRNKLEFTFSDKRWILPDEPFEQTTEELAALGFHILGRFDKVLDIKQCYLQPDLSNEIRNAIKLYCLENQLSFQNLRTHKGLMRNLIIRNSNTGEWMVIVVFGTDDSKQKKIELLEFISQKFPEIISLWHVENLKLNDSINDLEPVLFNGRPYIIENLLGMKFQVGPKSFMQTNSEQAQKLYQTVIDFAQLTGNELVYDLYTGIGTIANILAPYSKKVIGIEYIEEAIQAARINSENNRITNTEFFAGDMKDILNNMFFDRNGFPDIVVTDPPRAGMHGKVINNLLSIEPKNIVYISCNPATQARDIELLKSKYKVEKVQPVDMFPNTHHVENVVVLGKIQ